MIRICDTKSFEIICVNKNVYIGMPNSVSDSDSDKIYST